MAASLKILRDPGHFLALGAGTGLLRPAPGTWGSLLGVGVYVVVSGIGPLYYWLLVAILFAVGVPLCARTSRALGVKDHPAIVWDEVVGVLVTLGFGTLTLVSVVSGFLLFRLLDITKPGPIGLADRSWSGGFGIMADDLIAGLGAGCVLALIKYLSYS
jgi:phosphatidylglycerophosphatase A